MKIDRSGLGSYFRHAAVVPEKDPAAYQSLVAQLEVDPARTWMIGNSPKSDINPALGVGLNAVFIPHHATWRLEHQEINGEAGPGKLLVLERFPDLRMHLLTSAATPRCDPYCLGVRCFLARSRTWGRRGISLAVIKRDKVRS